jgi:hypothetical protein
VLLDDRLARVLAAQRILKASEQAFVVLAPRVVVMLERPSDVHDRDVANALVLLDARPEEPEERLWTTLHVARVDREVFASSYGALLPLT